MDAVQGNLVLLYGNKIRYSYTCFLTVRIIIGRSKPRVYVIKAAPSLLRGSVCLLLAALAFARGLFPAPLPIAAFRRKGEICPWCGRILSLCATSSALAARILISLRKVPTALGSKLHISRRFAAYMQNRLLSSLPTWLLGRGEISARGGAWQVDRFDFSKFVLRAEFVAC